MKPYKYIIIVSLFVAYLGTAQSIEKFSIDSGGASASAGGIDIIYTVGEVNVAERTSATVLISEGFINSSLSSTLGINDAVVSANDIIIYPNPASDILHISTDLDLTKMEMYDVLGKQVFKAMSFLDKINVNSYDSGVYFLKLYLNKTAVTKRVVIRK